MYDWKFDDEGSSFKCQLNVIPITYVGMTASVNIFAGDTALRTWNPVLF
jgi:hypothetical protein